MDSQRKREKEREKERERERKREKERERERKREKERRPRPPFSPSAASLYHPWFTTTNLSYRFPILKLPPLPCAVLLVSSKYWQRHRNSLFLRWNVYVHLFGRIQAMALHSARKTRWSPRTRMLTRMLMVQMSKHMDMQSRTIPFCNSLFEQSCTCFPCYQSAVWSGKCRVWSVECEV